MESILTVSKPEKIRPFHRANLKYAKEYERYCFMTGLNFNKRILNKISFAHRNIKSGYNVLLGCVESGEER